MNWSIGASGEIPGSDRTAGDSPGWTNTKLKYIADSIAGGTPDTDNANYWDSSGEGVSWIAIGDMSQRDTVLESRKSLTQLGILSKSLQTGNPGTILFAMYASVGEVAILRIPATWNQAILGLVARADYCTPTFLFYFLKTVKGHLPLLYRSTTQNNINAEQVMNLAVSLPSIKEQRAITEFLDREIAKLDAVIAKQEKLITMLREDRAATITHVVTTGLDSNAPTTKSDVAWIGDCPQHWDIIPVRAAMKESDIRNVGAADQRYLSLVANVGVIPYDEKGDVGNKKPEDLSKCKKVSKNDLVINSMNYQIGSYGLSIYNGVCSPVYIVLRHRPEVVSLRFAFRIFQASQFQKYAQSFGNGILEHRRSISWDTLKPLQIPLPPKDEQDAIVDYLDGRVARINGLIAKSTEMIETLREYRSVLIANAVTGKIDVREAV